jgi:hypothetical protein
MEGAEQYQCVHALCKTLLITCEYVEKPKRWKVIENMTSQNARHWKDIARGLCFDGFILIVFELAGLFQQTLP